MATQRLVANGAATSQGGEIAIQTRKVSNTLVAQTKLRFKLTAANDYASGNIFIFPGAARSGSNLALQNKLTYTCTTGFASYADMVSYYQKISTECYGLIIQTDDTDNYEDNILTIQEQDPSGRVTDVNIDLSDNRVDAGNGWSDKIVFDEVEFKQIFWPGMEMRLASLKPGTSMTFTFLLRDWNKVQELSPIRPTVIG